ncbi:integrase arm-type DNA-binding domain-containing protein [Methylomonas methanica]|uniref:integrase arm-type DNA-binding domain-containing protein n=1 Tax=Methylomonas methanica TaxID=421 RepID=UPI003B0113F3
MRITFGVTRWLRISIKTRSTGQKPKDKDYTINDGECLMMLVKANGSKLWRFIYRFKGKQNRLDFAS